MSYQSRQIRFREIIQVNSWQIKVYTIAKTGNFTQEAAYQSAIEQLPQWLAKENSFNAQHDHIGFLILHAGTEGVFSLVNWWVDGSMLNTHIFISPYQSPSSFTLISGNGLAPCVWELAIINHERVAWTQHFLKKAPQVDIQSYLLDQYNANI